MATSGNLADAFKAFADKGDEITTANTKKWFEKAKCFGKACSSNSLDIAYMKSKKDKKKKTINFDEFKVLIDVMAVDYAKDKKKSADEATSELTSKLSATQNIATGTKTANTKNVDRMTDTSKYTGAHKERFDESGKGKGAEGRKDTASNDGYVGGYKGKDTYQKK